MQTDETTPQPPKRSKYIPKPETLALLTESGNPINGLHETSPRRPSPFFWHPPDQHPYAELQIVARQSSRNCPGSVPAFAAAYDYPELIPVAEVASQSPPAQLAQELTDFALAHDADDVGITPMDPLYVFEGYTVDEPYVIVLALAHNYERLKQVPSDEHNGIGVCDIGDQYARGTRSSYALANWIRARGYNASPYPGPSANALLLIPPAPRRAWANSASTGRLSARASDQVSASPVSPPTCRSSRRGRTRLAATTSARLVKSAPMPVLPPPSLKTSRWCAASKDGTSTSTNASPTSPRTPLAESA